LTSDVPALGATLQALPALTVNGAVIVGCGVYLSWLYPAGLLALLGVIAAGVGVYWVLHSGAIAAIAGARQSRDEIMKSYRELAEGIKELKIHRQRRHEFVTDRLVAVGARLKDRNLAAMRKYLYLDAWSQGLFYLMLAGVLFFFPRDLENSAEILTGFAFAALYMMNPVWAIIGALPTLASGATALKKLDEIGLAFRSADEPAAAARPTTPRVDTIELDGVAFSYDRDGGEFHLGPLDLTLARGEIVFLVGGNGSGKTTLLKLLTGLYSPAAGTVRLNGETITAETADWYRQHFAAVFFDFYLFDRLLGAVQPDVDALAAQYLGQLELEHKVRIVERQFSTTQLSQGQRKRLALLTALIEERPVCIFDEWAADQDPHYKEIFYTRILPMLKARGRIVVVVTHDDRFFHYGDRVVKLEDGRIDTAAQPQVKTA
jgi:putative ATP-binding cassette transporter